MANIKIANLHPAGSELFSDSESYMNELGDSELDATSGGSTPMCVTATITISALSVAIASPLIIATKGPVYRVAPGRSRAF